MRMPDTLDASGDHAQTTEYDPSIDGRAVSRRAVIQIGGTGAAAGLAALLGACGGGGGDKKKPDISPSQMQADAEVLSALIEAERTAIAAYRAGAGRLSGGSHALALRVLSQETEHERAIARAIRSLGASPPAPRSQAAYASGFPRLTGADSVLRFALDVENTQIAAYDDALGTIVTPAIRVTLASILVIEAQHMSVMLGQLHEPQAPQALVTGSKPT
jgi:rubrerythrin